MNEHKISNEMLQLGVYALVVRGHGEDILMGLNIHNYVKLKGLEHLLDKFIVDLDIFFESIYKDDIPQFVKNLENKYRINLDNIRENLIENIQQMKQVKSENVMIYYLVITKTLEEVRKRIFEKYAWKIIDSVETKNAKTKEKFDSLTESLSSPDKITRKSDIKINPKERAAFSLVYNLIFIKQLAIFYEEKEFAERCQSLIEEQINIIF